MYERGSDQLHDLSYGSVYSASNGSANGSPNGYPSNGYAANGNSSNGYAANGHGSEDPMVWYRSPAGEETATQPAAGSSPNWYATPGNTTPSYAGTAYTGPSYDNTAYETAYPPAPQSSPATPAPAAAPDVTYDPATGIPLTADGFPYPMRNVAGRMAMVLGVFAILFTSILFPLFPVAFFFAIGAIVLGRRGRLRARYGFASNPGSAGGGFALGVISLVLVALWSALAAWLCFTYSAVDAKNCIQDTHNAPEAIHCLANVVDNT